MLKKVGIGCGGLVAAFLVLAIIGAIVGPSKKKASPASAPVAAAVQATAAPATARPLAAVVTTTQSPTQPATQAATKPPTQPPTQPPPKATQAPKPTKAPPPNITTYTDGATAQTKELAITVATISDPYTSPNQFTQPKSGNRYLLIHASAKDVDSREHTVNGFSFKLKTSDNHVYDPAFAATAGQSFDFTSLRSGEVTEGDVVFEVPQGATVTELRYDNGVGSDDLYWRP